MDKWGLALITLGLLLVMVASTEGSVNFIALISGAFYIVLGAVLVKRSKKKSNGGRS